MVLVGNKTDLQDRRQVRDMDGRNLAQDTIFLSLKPVLLEMKILKR